jgi:hypothetical protein
MKILANRTFKTAALILMMNYINPASGSPLSTFADGYLDRLSKSEGSKIKVIKRSENAEELKTFSELISPSFGINLKFDPVIYLVVEDVDTDRKYAVFLFKTPDSLFKRFSCFDHFAVGGMLQSELPTFYSAVANERIFAIVLSEFKKIPKKLIVVDCLAEQLEAGAKE